MKKSKKTNRLNEKKFPVLIKAFSFLFSATGFIVFLVATLHWIFYLYDKYHIGSDETYHRDCAYLYVNTTFILLISSFLFYSLGIITEAALVYIGLHKETKEEKNDIKE